jgi:hypothetical protein
MEEGHQESSSSFIEVFVMGSIFGLLILVALPAYLDQRTEEQACQLAEQFRDFGAAFHSYMFEYGHWPPDQVPGSVPIGMETRLSGFTMPSIIGGKWDWDSELESNEAGVCLVGFKGRRPVIEHVDFLLDDGDLSTGRIIHSGGRLMMLLH